MGRKKNDTIKVLDREFTDAMTKLKNSLKEYQGKIDVKRPPNQIVLESVEFLQGEVNKFCKATKITDIPKVTKWRFPPTDEQINLCSNCFVGYTNNGDLLFIVDGLYQKFVDSRMKKK